MARTFVRAPSHQFGGTATRLRREARQKNRPPTGGRFFIYASPERLVQKDMVLDTFYVPTRYPDAGLRRDLLDRAASARVAAEPPCTGSPNIRRVLRDVLGGVIHQYELVA